MSLVGLYVRSNDFGGHFQIVQIICQLKVSTGEEEFDKIATSSICSEYLFWQNVGAWYFNWGKNKFLTKIFGLKLTTKLRNKYKIQSKIPIAELVKSLRFASL